ncbi:MAG: hypothetical protein JHC31_11765 [Sulfurihydrogenibium sp.]|nr:hypothetical protein [Sulfurihydrogenibium sp.]
MDNFSIEQYRKNVENIDLKILELSKQIEKEKFLVASENLALFKAFYSQLLDSGLGDILHVNIESRDEYDDNNYYTIGVVSFSFEGHGSFEYCDDYFPAYGDDLLNICKSLGVEKPEDIESMEDFASALNIPLFTNVVQVIYEACISEELSRIGIFDYNDVDNMPFSDFVELVENNIKFGNN